MFWYFVVIYIVIQVYEGLREKKAPYMTPEELKRLLAEQNAGNEKYMGV